MQETFERIEKHLYKRQYQTGVADWRTIFYAVFTDWQGKRRKFALGSSLDDARDELGRLRQMNKGRYNWDLEKRERDQKKIKAMTVGEWLDSYLDLVKNLGSYKTKRTECRHLKRLLGDLPLSEVTKVRIMEYKNRRLSEAKISHGEAVEGTKIQGASVNREVSCLITALNLAADQGLCEGAPKVKKERETPRERILTGDEYKAIVAAAPRWLQRVIIAANETAMDRGALLRLTWDGVQDGLISIKGGRAKTGARQAVGVSPSLKIVLDELRAEFRRVPNMDKRVFTKGGKPIKKSALRKAFDRAMFKAEIEDFQFRDFRHCARTRWAAAGLPFEIGELAIGHKLKGISGRYINLSDDQIRGAFREMYQKLFPTLPQENPDAASANQ